MNSLPGYGLPPAEQTIDPGATAARMRGNLGVVEAYVTSAMPSSSKSAILLCISLAACTSSRDGPSKTVERYLAAIDANRPDLAYPLLDERIRRRVSRNDFIGRWRAARLELADQKTRLRKALDKPYRVVASIRYDSGLQARLIYLDKRWTVQEGMTQSLETASPTDALRAFIHAIESRDYPSVMKLVSRSMRETIEREIEERLTRLKKITTTPNKLAPALEVTGNKARLQYDRQYKIELIRESGEWKILDFD